MGTRRMWPRGETVFIHLMQVSGCPKERETDGLLSPDKLGSLSFSLAGQSAGCLVSFVSRCAWKSLFLCEYHVLNKSHMQPCDFYWVCQSRREWKHCTYLGWTPFPCWVLFAEVVGWRLCMEAFRRHHQKKNINKYRLGPLKNGLGKYG